MPRLPPPVSNTHGIALHSRYTIRPITPAMATWAKALMIQGFLLHPSIWRPLLPEPKTTNTLEAFAALDGHFAHSINSGLSYGIFDSQYVFRRSRAASSGGRLYWDELDPQADDFEVTGESRMLEGMDFPLVCIALSVDAFDQKPKKAARALHAFLPFQSQVTEFLAGCDPRPPASSTPTGWGQLLIRSGCVTRPEYENYGLMSALNHFVMLEARARAYQAISVGVSSPSVYRNWMNAPPGCHSTVISAFDFWDIEVEDENGQIVAPYVGSGVRDGWLIWCDLTG